MDKRIVSEKTVLFAAFILPLMIVLAVFAMIGIAPFGGYSLAVIDAKQQYIQFSGFLVNVLKNGESLLYSWKQILGGPLAGLFGYYLASPFELLFLLFSQEQLLSALPPW